jgi:hypothetical protein
MDLTIEIAQEAGEIVIRAGREEAGKAQAGVREYDSWKSDLAEYDSWPAAFRKPGAAS